MPWSTPTLKDVRTLVRDSVRAYLPGADAAVPNSVLRVMSDNQGALCHLTLQYLDWLALQLMPDTAEHEWLDRHGDIWLVNADGSTGRKVATLARGTVTVTGIGGTILPFAQQMRYGGGFGAGASTAVTYETTEEITIDTNAATPVSVRALDPGTIGNQVEGVSLQLVDSPPNADPTAMVVEIQNGTDEETDDELRARVLRRIQQPPMGGDQSDYEAWALAVPGVTRAWAVGMEMGIGTCSLRFMMDDLRADNDGVPLPDDVTVVAAYVNSKRPVTVKEMWVLAPLKQPIDFAIVNLTPDTPAIRGAIEAQCQSMLLALAAPGQTIYAAWKYTAVMTAAGVYSFDLASSEDDVMPDVGHIAVLGDIYYSVTTPASPSSASAQKMIA